MVHDAGRRLGYSRMAGPRKMSPALPEGSSWDADLAPLLCRDIRMSPPYEGTHLRHLTRLTPLWHVSTKSLRYQPSATGSAACAGQFELSTMKSDSNTHRTTLARHGQTQPTQVPGTPHAIGRPKGGVRPPTTVNMFKHTCRRTGVETEKRPTSNLGITSTK